MADTSEECAGLEWTNEKPVKGGIYFRTTLWGRVVRQDVIEITPERLLVYQGGKSALLEKLDDGFFWFGPIPDPPPEADRVAAQQRAKQE